MNSCSCLTLILACIIYWQAKEITERVRSGAAAEEDIDTRLLQHVSPIEWGQRHPVRPVRARSRPCPLKTDPYVVFQQQSGRYPHEALPPRSDIAFLIRAPEGLQPP